MKLLNKIKKAISGNKQKQYLFQDEETEPVKNGIVYLDRLCRENIGARSTGKAIYQIVDEIGLKTISTFDISIAQQGGIDLFKSINEIAEQFLLSKNTQIVNLLSSLKKTKAIVINGEGSMIFATPKRLELGTHLALIKIAKLFGKKTYYINSVASACTKTGINKTTLSEVREIIQNYCDFFIVRDPLSYNFAQKNISKKVKYIPDALFTWMKYLDVGLQKPLIGDLILPFPDSTFDYGKFDFNQQYILISDSSLNNTYDNKTIQAYIKLVNKVKLLGKKVYLIQTSGFHLLNEVAQATGLQYIPATANLLMLFSILANADLFISGRFHPSILAMLGGTPCVFMNSNCHKTLALQVMMDIDKCHEYNSVPSDSEIEQIYSDAFEIIQRGAEYRETIKKQARRLSQEALCIKEYLLKIKEEV